MVITILIIMKKMLILMSRMTKMMKMTTMVKMTTMGKMTTIGKMTTTMMKMKLAMENYSGYPSLPDLLRIYGLGAQTPGVVVPRSTTVVASHRGAQQPAYLTVYSLPMM